MEREWNSAAKFTSALDRLRFRFDSSLPLGSAQRQKIVVIDNAVAFLQAGWVPDESGAGTPASILADPSALIDDPEGKPYPPFHDVQCLIEGQEPRPRSARSAAARRWAAAGCTLELDPKSGAIAGLRLCRSEAKPGDHDRHRADRVENRVARRGGKQKSAPTVRGLNQFG